jgi:chromosome segregation ATPase
MCKCNGRGYVGHDARNKKAECVDVTTLGGGGSDEAMVEKVEVLQEEMVAVEGGVKGLQEDKQGIESSIESATADILALQEFQTSTEEGTTLANDALKTAQGDIVTLNGKLDDSNQQLTELKDLVNTLVATNTKLVSALKGAQATVPDAPKEPSPDRSFAPEVNGDAGGIDFKLQKGRHATVNDEMLLTATEVAELIKGAVQDTLNAVGGALE